jgi:hypothetical protein
MKILALIPESADATSFYRGQGPLNELHKCRPNELIQVTYVNPNAIRFQDTKGFDVLFVQRPDIPSFLHVIKMIKALNIPVVVDYDDYLLEVPVGNRYHKIMTDNDNPYELIVKQILEIADHITVSTEELKKQLSQYNKNITVIRNAFDNYCFKLCETFSKKKKILWRGGATHQPDFDFYGDEIYLMIKENQDFEFNFWTETTQRPENLAYSSISQLLQKLDNIKIINPVDTINYLQNLAKLNPCLIVTVNQENTFNLCKSDCAKIEGFYCGALTVANDWPEWTWGHKPEKSYLLKRVNEYLEMIRNREDGRCQEIYSQELQFVKDNRLLSQANELRYEVFKSVIKYE